MVTFILAAAAAFLLCVLLQSPIRVSAWLPSSKYVLRQTLFLLFLVAVLFSLVVAAGNPSWVLPFLFSLVILFQIWATSRLARPQSPRGRITVWWFAATSGLASAVLFAIDLAAYMSQNEHGVVFWISVAVVALLALSATAAAVAWWVGWPKNLLPKRPQTLLVLLSVLALAAIFGLFAVYGNVWPYALLLTVRRIASMRETTYGVLGAVLGLMCGNFSHWMNYARIHGIGHSGESRLWPVIIFGGALACVVLAAVLAPYEQTALSRLSGVETPYLKVQFAIPPSLADRQQVLSVERDLNYTDTLEAFPNESRFIQYDCAQAALDAQMGIAKFRSDHPEKYLEFAVALVFVEGAEGVLPYVNQLVNAKRTSYNRVVLNLRARNVAEKFAHLATKENLVENDDAAMHRFKENYESAMKEVKDQKQLFEKEGVGADLTAEEKQRRHDDPDPDYCSPSNEEKSSASDIRNIWKVAQKRPRPILELAASLFHFVGDTGAANAIRKQIFNLNRSTDDINAIGAHAAALYIEGDDLREVIRVRQADLQVVESRLGQSERAKADEQVKAVPEADNKAHGDLVRRYNRARFQDRLRLAYLWAQHGLAAEGDLLPERDLHWSSAQKYADDAYEALLGRSTTPRFLCMDDELDLVIKGTYGFVKLAHQAYDLKTRRTVPDEFQIRRTRAVLEEALAEAREQHRRLLEAWPSCFTVEETTAWIRRISNHLRLADALQP